MDSGRLRCARIPRADDGGILPPGARTPSLNSQDEARMLRDRPPRIAGVRARTCISPDLVA